MATKDKKAPRRPARSKALTSTFVPGVVPPEWINLATAIAYVADKTGLILSPHGIRRWPIEHRIVNKVTMLNSAQVLQHAQAMIDKSPSIMAGSSVPLTERRTIGPDSRPAKRPRSAMPA